MHFILPYFIIILIVLQFAIKKSTRNHKTRNEEFLDRETKANQVRRKDISRLNYISIPDNLPLINSGNDTFDRLMAEDSRMKRSYDTIQSLRDKKILNLTGISNTELKLSYGAANLKDAAAYLEYGISIKSDISSNYIDLAIIYASYGRKELISALKEQASQLKSLSRDSIISQLDDILKK